MKQYSFKRTFLSGFALKLISTLLYVAGRVLLELDFSKAGALYIAGNIMIYMSLPIISFLAVEGYRYTHNAMKYLLRVVMVGSIVELIIDYTLFGADVGRYMLGNNLNIFLTLALGIGMLLCLDAGRSMVGNSPFLRNVFTIIMMILFALAAILLGAEHAGGIIFMMAAMYLFYGNPFLILIAVAAVQIVILGSVDMILLLYAPVIGQMITWLYNGKRGYRSIASRGLFYAVYPIAYVIVAMIIKAGL